MDLDAADCEHVIVVAPVLDGSNLRKHTLRAQCCDLYCGHTSWRNVSHSTAFRRFRIPFSMLCLWLASLRHTRYDGNSSGNIFCACSCFDRVVFRNAGSTQSNIEVESNDSFVL